MKSIRYLYLFLSFLKNYTEQELFNKSLLSLIKEEVIPQCNFSTNKQQ